MLEHEIKGDMYYIYDADHNEVLSIKLVNNIPGNQIIIQTEKEVFAGPISLISFNENFTND